jgi:hypothetical protein
LLGCLLFQMHSLFLLSENSKEPRRQRYIVNLKSLGFFIKWNSQRSFASFAGRSSQLGHYRQYLAIRKTGAPGQDHHCPTLYHMTDLTRNQPKDLRGHKHSIFSSAPLSFPQRHSHSMSNRMVAKPTYFEVKEIRHLDLCCQHYLPFPKALHFEQTIDHLP